MESYLLGLINMVLSIHNLPLLLFGHTVHFDVLVRLLVRLLAYLLQRIVIAKLAILIL